MAQYSGVASKVENILDPSQTKNGEFATPTVGLSWQANKNRALLVVFCSTRSLLEKRLECKKSSGAT
jgi:hypothetical protein